MLVAEIDDEDTCECSNCHKVVDIETAIISDWAAYYWDFTIDREMDSLCPDCISTLNLKNDASGQWIRE